MFFFKRFCFVIIPVLMVAESASTEAKDSRNVIGLGTVRCDKAIDELVSSESALTQYMAWLEGYLSGMNAARQKDGLEVADLSLTQYERVLNVESILYYCTGNPSSYFSDAVNVLFEHVLNTQELD